MSDVFDGHQADFDSDVSFAIGGTVVLARVDTAESTVSQDRGEDLILSYVAQMHLVVAELTCGSSQYSVVSKRWLSLLSSAKVHWLQSFTV